MIELVETLIQGWGNDSYPTLAMFVFPITTVLTLNTVLFVLVHLWTNRDNSWIDSWWPLSFCVPNIMLLVMRGSENIALREWIITVPVFIWAARLSWYLTVRHKGEDYRYAILRKWQKKMCGPNELWYYLWAWQFIWLGQGFMSLINNASVLYVNMYADKKTSSDVNVLDGIGLLVWAIGFYIELEADSSLARHL